MSERPRRSEEAPDSDAIEARARAAVDAARRTVAESEVIATVLRLQRDEGLLVRCAWCGRYSLGAEWMEEEKLTERWGLVDKLEAEQITHSICPDCVTAVQ